MNLTSPLVGMALLAALVTAGALAVGSAHTGLERAVASLTLADGPPSEQEVRRPREHHRLERGRRPSQRPSRPPSYDW